jgi:hypothetical protein
MAVQSNYCSQSLRLSGITVVAFIMVISHVLPARAVCYDDLLIGEDFRLTVYSASATEQPEISGKTGDANTANKVATVCAIFDELRGCWVPPPSSQARTGMEITVRFAFKRNGEIIAAPRVTCVTAGASPETQVTYLKAITAALDRCTPMHFTESLASVVVGHPFAIRFVDDRTGLSQ